MEMVIRISLVIPVFNEGNSITQLLQSINEQTVLPDEIIFVDGGSSDYTVPFLKNYISTKSRFRVIEAGRAMPGKGRNIGVENATFEWIAFTDAGIKLDKKWLENLVKTVRDNPGTAIVYGNYSPVTDSFFNKCAAIAYVPPQQENNIRGKFIASSLFKKEVCEKVGGFPDWRAAEDLIFMENVEHSGYMIKYTVNAMVYWQLRPTIKATFQKFDMYSMYNVWAGQQKNWHYGVAKQYGLLFLFFLLGFFHSGFWFLLIPLWILARVIKRIWSHRFEFGTKLLFNPAVLLMVMYITLIIDSATFTGWIKAALRKPDARTFSAQ